MKRLSIILSLILIIIKCLAVSYQEYNPNDERFRVLALQKAKIRLEQSERDWKNAKELFEKKLISQSEYKEYELQYQNDKISFQQYMLTVIYDKPHIMVLSAAKSQSADGKNHVELIIQNNSGGNYGIEESLLKEVNTDKLSPSVIHNVYVSLHDLQGNIISQPYEYHIATLKLNEKKRINFSILKDVESVIVTANYGDKIDQKQIYLSRKTDSNLVNITPNYFSQEVESGQTAIFDLKMEYFGNTRENISYELINLPALFTYELSSENIVLNQFALSSSEPTKNLQLKINIPEKSGSNIELDKPYLFEVVLKNKENAIVGQTELQIIPTSKADLRISFGNQYWKGNDHERIEFVNIKLENKGMKTITNLNYDIFLPNDWEYKVSPEKIEKLDPKEKVNIKLEIIPSKNTLPGIYSLRFKVNGSNVNRIVQTTEQDLKVELVKKTNIFVIIISLLFSIAIVIGAGYFFWKISKN
ncbi:MAG TPA: NEW3 domain-containing protein [Candidatus Cloacimonadota bacterium]|nr:NEW3 domain-containing protein [Candidatus Cloacimonadota bacterium]HPM01372.1 NEW3 domain-containing protein [Candidatus Cloacimonadota bacterium]